MTYLIRRHLEVVSLIGKQVAQLHGEHASTVSDNQWKIPVLEVNVIGALEVVENRDLLFSVGLAVSELEEGILCVATILNSLPGEVLNGIHLVVCSKCEQNEINLKRSLTHHRPCLCA